MKNSNDLISLDQIINEKIGFGRYQIITVLALG